MSELQRLLTGEATKLERRLLGAWQQRQPSAEARARARAVAGIGLGAAIMTGAGITTVKAATTSIAPKVVAGGAVVLMKWVAVGILSAAATAGAVAYVHHVDQAAAKTNIPRRFEPRRKPIPTRSPRRQPRRRRASSSRPARQPAPRAQVSPSARSKKHSNDAHPATLGTHNAKTTVEPAPVAPADAPTLAADLASIIDARRRALDDRPGASFGHGWECHDGLTNRQRVRRQVPRWRPFAGVDGDPDRSPPRPGRPLGCPGSRRELSRVEPIEPLRPPHPRAARRAHEPLSWGAHAHGVRSHGNSTASPVPVADRAARRSRRAALVGTPSTECESAVPKLYESRCIGNESQRVRPL